jgi:membrane protein
MRSFIYGVWFGLRMHELVKMIKKETLPRLFIRLFNDSFREFTKNDPLRQAGATAFFTTFALPAILIIIIQILGLIVDRKQLSIHLFNNIAGIIGQETTVQLIHTLRAVRKVSQNWAITIGGFVFLLFVATTLFRVIKSSLNQIWKIRVIKKQTFAQIARSRFKAILIIFSAGILFIIGILAEGVQAFLGNYIHSVFPMLATYFSTSLNYLISIITVTAWFLLVFRFLPDGKPTWRVGITGAFVTSILFNIGKFVLGWLLTYSNINTIYGASASTVLLLLFVFYTAMIFYFGAAFTKIWGIYKNEPIKPLPHAIHYQIMEVDHEPA